MIQRDQPRHAEAVGEDQPARTQVVDQDLAGHALVGRGRVLDADAGHLRAQQLLDRQLAAAIGEADDDPIDLVPGDERGHVRRRADDPGIDDALADPRRVVVDEADDAVGEFALGEDLPHHLARGLAGADDEDALLHA